MLGQAKFEIYVKFYGNIMKKKDTENFTEETINISQLAKVTNLPFTKVRYWANNGLIRRNKNPDNGYYEYDINSVSDVISIKMMRSIGFSFKMIYKMLLSKKDLWPQLYEEAKKRLLEQIDLLNFSLEKIKMQQKAYERAKNWTDEISMAEPPFCKIKEIHLKNADTKEFNLDDATTFRVIENNHIVEQYYGYAVYDSSEKHNIIWEKSTKAKYFHFVIHDRKEEYFNEIVQNALLRVCNMGFNCVNMLSRYMCSILMNEQDTGAEKFVNYYDAWIETYPKKS